MVNCDISNWCVYKHTSPSGGVYIGITHQPVLDRWQNGKGYKRHPHFYAAILKYGWDNFKHEILYTNLTKAEAATKEIELIKVFREFNCYNIGPGGEYVYDSSKTVYQYDHKTGNFIRSWKGAAECARYFNVTHSTITNCCNSEYRTKTACGFIFSYDYFDCVTPIITNDDLAVIQYDIYGKFVKRWNSLYDLKKEYRAQRFYRNLNVGVKFNEFVWAFEGVIPKLWKLEINGLKFSSVNTAKDYFNVSWPTIKSWINKNKNNAKWLNK